MAAVIRHYFYGTAEEPNRQIQFSREDERLPSSLVVRIYGRKEGTWATICDLQARDIQVEVSSHSEKIRMITESSFNKTPQPEFKTKTLDQFPIEEQDDILKNLYPNGSRKIEISSSPGDAYGLEKVESMTIFDAS